MHMIRVSPQSWEKTDMPILRKASRRTEQTTGLSASSQSLYRQETFLGVYFQTHKGQEGNQKDSIQADHASSSRLLSVTKITCSWDEEREVDTIYLGLLHFLTLRLSHTRWRVEEVRAKSRDS